MIGSLLPIVLERKRSVLPDIFKINYFTTLAEKNKLCLSKHQIEINMFCVMCRGYTASLAAMLGADICNAY